MTRTDFIMQTMIALSSNPNVELRIGFHAHNETEWAANIKRAALALADEAKDLGFDLEFDSGFRIAKSENQEQL